MGQLLLKMIVGALVGMAVWAPFEAAAPAMLTPAWSNWEQLLTLTFGAALGLAVGGLNGWIQGSRTHLLRGAGLGLLFGGIAAPLGHSIGGALMDAVFHDPTILIGDAPMTTKMFARILGLTPIGALVGLAIGASSLNGRRAVQGLIGGLLGAGVGALLFDPIGGLLSPASVALNQRETGAVSRALYFVIVGALVALFIAIVDLLARSAWVRLVLGRNEGKEWPIDAGQTFIGRSEGANIPLFGDPNIAPMHACIVRQAGGAYVLADGGSPAGTYLDGQRIQQAPLYNGAQIQVGSYALLFLMKHGAAPVRGPEQFNQAYAIQGSSPGQPVGAAPAGYPAAPPPGSLYGSAPAPAMPAPSGAFAAQQPTVAFSPAQSGGFALVGADGPLVGRRYPVRAAIELGRESAAIPMSFDTGASRRHASVAPGPAGLTVSDLGSTNGTFVNGHRVQTANVGPGDLIRIGATTFRVEPA